MHEGVQWGQCVTAHLLAVVLVCVQIAVEGNIASGKSTLLDKLSQLESVEVRDVLWMWLDVYN